MAAAIWPTIQLGTAPMKTNPEYVRAASNTSPVPPSQVRRAEDQHRSREREAKDDRYLGDADEHLRNNDQNGGPRELYERR
jgi:hypothetical protein